MPKDPASPGLLMGEVTAILFLILVPEREKELREGKGESIALFVSVCQKDPPSP